MTTVSDDCRFRPRPAALQAAKAPTGTQAWLSGAPAGPRRANHQQSGSKSRPAEHTGEGCTCHGTRAAGDMERRGSKGSGTYLIDSRKMKASESLALNFWMAPSLRETDRKEAQESRWGRLARPVHPKTAARKGLAGSSTPRGGVPQRQAACPLPPPPVLQAGAAIDAQVAHGAAAQALRGMGTGAGGWGWERTRGTNRPGACRYGPLSTRRRQQALTGRNRASRRGAAGRQGQGGQLTHGVTTRGGGGGPYLWQLAPAQVHLEQVQQLGHGAEEEHPARRGRGAGRCRHVAQARTVTLLGAWGQGALCPCRSPNRAVRLRAHTSCACWTSPYWAGRSFRHHPGGSRHWQRAGAAAARVLTGARSASSSPGSGRGQASCHTAARWRPPPPTSRAGSSAWGGCTPAGGDGTSAARCVGAACDATRWCKRQVQPRLASWLITTPGWSTLRCKIRVAGGGLGDRLPRPSCCMQALYALQLRDGDKQLKSALRPYCLQTARCWFWRQNGRSGPSNCLSASCR